MSGTPSEVRFGLISKQSRLTTEGGHGAMVRSSSLFSQVLGLISRIGFAKDAKTVKAERHAKGFSSWDHFVSMIFCQLAQSLREITNGLRCLFEIVLEYGTHFPRPFSGQSQGETFEGCGHSRNSGFAPSPYGGRYSVGFA